MGESEMFSLDSWVEKLESIILNITYTETEDQMITPTIHHLMEIRDILNNIFKESKCLEVKYTNNTDNVFFGVKVSPSIDNVAALKILITDDKVKYDKYKIELDSKLFSYSFTAEQLAAYILYEVSSTVDSYELNDRIRDLIDIYLLTNDDVISIRDSSNYSQLVIFALKDTIDKLTSLIYVEPEALIGNRYIQALNLQDAIIDAHDKVTDLLNSGDQDIASPKVVILQWMLQMYKDMRLNSTVIVDALKDAKLCTGSTLVKDEIDKTIAAVDRIDFTIPMKDESTLYECALDKFFEKKNMYSLNELSLFKSMKQNGLRSIEDGLYEFAMRMKNCDTEEDAMYILRGINTRLNVLEDYIYNTPELSDRERKKWQNIANQYRELRVQLAKKKIWKKNSYGLFFDYNQTFEGDPVD